jgi:effector-binding domain-containing protein
MQIREIQPIHFLYFKTETKLSKLSDFVGKVPKALQLEAAKLGLLVTGPNYWSYFNFYGNPNEFFTLEISLPVDALPVNYTGEFLLKTTTLFKCLSTHHEGNWLDMPTTYNKLMTYISHHQLTPNGENRELYINCDFENPAANFTEIQIGLQ